MTTRLPIEHYMNRAYEADKEIARLRELTEMQDQANDAVLNANVRLRERVEELERQLNETHRVLTASNAALNSNHNRARLLLEAVRWLHSELSHYDSCLGSITPPKFAPLIAEAVKEQNDG